LNDGIACSRRNSDRIKNYDCEKINREKYAKK